MRVRAARECKASGRVFENYKQVRFRENLSCFVLGAPERVHNPSPLVHF